MRVACDRSARDRRAPSRHPHRMHDQAPLNPATPRHRPARPVAATVGVALPAPVSMKNSKQPPHPAPQRPHAAGARRRAAADGRPAVSAVAVGRNRVPRDGVGDPLTRPAIRPRTTLYSRNGNPTRLAERALLVARLTQAARFLLHVPNVMPPAMAAFAFLRRHHGWRLR